MVGQSLYSIIMSETSITAYGHTLISDGYIEPLLVPTKLAKISHAQRQRDAQEAVEQIADEILVPTGVPLVFQPPGYDQDRPDVQLARLRMMYQTLHEARRKEEEIDPFFAVEALPGDLQRGVAATPLYHTVEAAMASVEVRIEQPQDRAADWTARLANDLRAYIQDRMVTLTLQDLVRELEGPLQCGFVNMVSTESSCKGHLGALLFFDTGRHAETRVVVFAELVPRRLRDLPTTQQSTDALWEAATNREMDRYVILDHADDDPVATEAAKSKAVYLGYAYVRKTRDS